MKKLYEVSLQDALSIAENGHVPFALDRKWEIVDRSKDLNEPCIQLRSDKNMFSMWFFEDDIELDHEYLQDRDIPMRIMANVKCYVKAHNLGYHIPAFDQLENKAAQG